MRPLTQYGDLVRQAGQQILTASVALEAEAMRDLAAGQAACTAYADLFHALAGHGRRLFGSETRLLAVRASVNCDAREAAAARLIDHLAHIGLHALDRPMSDHPVAEAWLRAADRVRAASDLLATHRNEFGDPRTPAAALLDDLAVRTAGFGELASLTVPVAMASRSLARRLGELGMPEIRIDHLVPETRPLREAAFEARRVANLGGLGLPLAEMQVAKPAICRQAPLVELGDRLDRLHRVAWQLRKEDWVGICNLADLSAVGVFLNEHGAGGVRRVIAADPTAASDLSTRRLLTRFEGAAGAWREVHMEIRKFRTMTPALPGLRGDVMAVRSLLDELVDDPKLPYLLLTSAVRFGEVAGWNHETFEHQARRCRVYVPGRYLTGNQVSDDPWLVRIKRKGWLAPVLKENLQLVSEAYGRARDRSLELGALSPPFSAPSLTL